MLFQIMNYRLLTVSPVVSYKDNQDRKNNNSIFLKNKIVLMIAIKRGYDHTIVKNNFLENFEHLYF